MVYLLRSFYQFFVDSYRWFFPESLQLVEVEEQKQEALVTSYKVFIKQQILPIALKYEYQGEENINPAYQSITDVNKRLNRHEKRIWALREDFILATGVKNAYQERYGYTGFKDAFPDEIDLNQYIDLKDRFGHPSLTFNHFDEKIKVYYAGYLSQGENCLSVCLASGRYYRNDLTDEQIKVLETYLSILFQQAYGSQKVIFYYGIKDFTDYKTLDEYYEHLGVFFCDNEEKLASEPKRHYFPI